MFTFQQQREKSYLPRTKSANRTSITHSHTHARAQVERKEILIAIISTRSLFYYKNTNKRCILFARLCRNKKDRRNKKETNTSGVVETEESVLLKREANIGQSVSARALHYSPLIYVTTEIKHPDIYFYGHNSPV